MVSVLWLRTSGRAARTAFSASSSPLKSGIRTSTLQPGCFPDPQDRLRPVQRAAVRQVVAVDRGNNGVRQIKMFYGFGDVGRLHRVEVHRLAFIHGAKPAVARARVAAEHKCRGLVRPAFENIRAARFLADGVEI